jgi:hypothetical protein
MMKSFYLGVLCCVWIGHLVAATYSSSFKSSAAGITSQGQWLTVPIEIENYQKNRCVSILGISFCCPLSILPSQYPNTSTARQYTFNNPTIQYFNEARDIKQSLHLVLKEAFEHKTITWFGDSIMRQKYRALVMMLTMHQIPFTHNVSAYEMHFTSSAKNSSSQPAYEHILECASVPHQRDMCTRYSQEYILSQKEEETWLSHPLKKNFQHRRRSHKRAFHNNLSPKLRKRHLSNPSTLSSIDHQQQQSFSSQNVSQFYKYSCKCIPLWTLTVPSYNFVLHYVNLYKFHIPADYLPQDNPMLFTHANSNILHYQMFYDLLLISDHVLVNAGLHEETTSTAAFSSLIRFFIDTLSQDMKKRPVTKRWSAEHGVEGI